VTSSTISSLGLGLGIGLGIPGALIVFFALVIFRRRDTRKGLAQQNTASRVDQTNDERNGVPLTALNIKRTPITVLEVINVEEGQSSRQGRLCGVILLRLM